MRLGLSVLFALIGFFLMFGLLIGSVGWFLIGLGFILMAFLLLNIERDTNE